MSRKLLIGWCLMPLFTFSSLFIQAQIVPVSVSDYYFSYNREQNFSVVPWLTFSNLSLSFQNQFLLKELCTISVTGNYNTKGNAVLLSISHFGYSKYGVFTFSSGYARTFAKRVSFGLQTHYLLHHVTEYPKKHSFTFDLSLYGKISAKVGVGVSAYNAAKLKYGMRGKEPIPMKYILMLDFVLSEKLVVAVTASKQLPGFFNIAGTLYFKDKFYGFLIDASAKKVNTQFSFWLKKVQFDVGGSFDYKLGYSPFVKIGYCF